MVNRYRRVARTVVEAGLGNLVPFDQAIPEVAAANTAADSKRETRKRRSSTRNNTAIGLIAQLVELRTFKSDEPDQRADDEHDSPTTSTVEDEAERAPLSVQPRSAAASLDASLARALDLATHEGDLALVRRILDQLEQRQRSAAGNVVAIDTSAKKGGRS
jgi:hypothetical protein